MTTAETPTAGLVLTFEPLLALLPAALTAF
jgi:hypothetical protein